MAAFMEGFWAIAGIKVRLWYAVKLRLSLAMFHDEGHILEEVMNRKLTLEWRVNALDDGRVASGECECLCRDPSGE